jgi:hypothetical protein
MANGMQEAVLYTRVGFRNWCWQTGEGVLPSSIIVME